MILIIFWFKTLKMFLYINVSSAIQSQLNRKATNRDINKFILISKEAALVNYTAHQCLANSPLALCAWLVFRAAGFLYVLSLLGWHVVTKILFMYERQAELY